MSVSQKPSVQSSSRRFTTKANPFKDNNELTSRDIDSCSPNPFNPFNICDSNSSRPKLPTPPPPTPPPPPRPPSGDCPPVPPRNDLMKVPPELAPPLPRRRTTIIDNKLSHESKQRPPNRSIDPFMISNNSIDNNCSPPPIPNPQRKTTQRKINPNWDPFNCQFVENQLSSIASNSNNSNNKMLNDLSVDNFDSSTPKMTANSVPPPKKDLKLSEIHSPYSWVETNDENSDHLNDSRSETPPVFVDDFQCVNNRKTDQQFNNPLINSSLVSKQLNLTQEEERDSHISPPERNIFIVKSDPFADEFFAN